MWETELRTANPELCFTEFISSELRRPKSAYRSQKPDPQTQWPVLLKRAENDLIAITRRYKTVNSVYCLPHFMQSVADFGGLSALTIHRSK